MNQNLPHGHGKEKVNLRDKKPVPLILTRLQRLVILKIFFRLLKNG